MKLVKLIIVILASITVTAAPIERIPNVSSNFVEAIAQFKKTAAAIIHQPHFFESEGEWSNAKSSDNWEYDYYVVKASNADGGRILRFRLNSGLAASAAQVTFLDVVSGETFMASLSTKGSGTGTTHTGILNTGSDTYQLLIAYESDLRFPKVSITWGCGAAPGDVGTLKDGFAHASPILTMTETALMTGIGQSDVLPYGAYLFVGSPKEFGEYTVETTSDMATWTSVTVQPMMVLGDVVVYQLQTTENLGFFRVKL
jgi:hypothetical protein